MAPIKQPILLEVPERFETERLVLKAHATDTIDELQTAIEESLPELEQWMPWAKGGQTREETLTFLRRAAAEYITRDSFGYAIFARDDRRYIGNVGVHPRDWNVPAFEIGYWMRTSETGRGYMTEAVKFLTSYFVEEIGAKRMVIRCDSRNRASANVALRSGYTYEGVNRSLHRDNQGKLMDMELYSYIVPEE
jgi:RimJ/RimL family protein N-acetyltransferase